MELVRTRRGKSGAIVWGTDVNVLNRWYSEDVPEV